LRRGNDRAGRAGSFLLPGRPVAAAALLRRGGSGFVCSGGAALLSAAIFSEARPRLAAQLWLEAVQGVQGLKRQPGSRHCGDDSGSLSGLEQNKRNRDDNETA